MNQDIIKLKTSRYGTVINSKGFHVVGYSIKHYTVTCFTEEAHQGETYGLA